MPGRGFGPDAIEGTWTRPARNYGRSLIYGLLAGIGAAFLWLETESSFRASLQLFAALISGDLSEAVAGLLNFASVTLMVLLVGLVFASPTAFPFIAFMVRFEQKAALLQEAWVWGLLGLVFAMPMGVWMAWPSIPEPGVLSAHSLAPLCLYLVCGAIGGVAAWFGFYRPIRSDP
ncbi:hypothetical protein [Novosphingobium sp.]|uniref:hypothetical protein n=1 Tax=Novosphingobium sp. TaxID=1874826 RepID=UPI0035AE65D3